MQAGREVTVEDLYRVPENAKAELVRGELVIMSPGGDAHGYAAAEVFVSLREHARRTKSGRAIPDNVGFLVDLPTRRSFSPDAAYYMGPPCGARFIDGAPMFAVEVRSVDDYGPAAEVALAGKRADYFAAGTLVVWDVDVLRDRVVRVYRVNDPNPTIFGAGETADAEPAVHGWSMLVDDLFLPE